MSNEFQVPDELLARCVDRLDLVQRVLKAFVQQLDDDIPTLVGLVDRGSAEEVRKLAHRVKGAAANVAASSLQSSVSELEELAIADRLDGVQPKLDLLCENWQTYKNQTASFISG